MTKMRPANPPRETDPATVLRDPREHRGKLSLDEIMQLAAIYEPIARQVQQKIERGDKIYRWDRNSLEYWERLTIELSRLQSTGL